MTCRHQGTGDFSQASDLLLLLGDLAGLLRSLLHCALRLLRLLRFLGHVALRYVRWLCSLRAFGDRDALHPKYTNTTKKNIVPLKEVLTHQAACALRALRKHTTR